MRRRETREATPRGKSGVPAPGSPEPKFEAPSEGQRSRNHRHSALPGRRRIGQRKHARMLQQMTLTLIEIGQKIVDPPMIAVGDAIQGGTNLYAGAINWVDPDYDERTGEVLRPITLNGEGLHWGTEYEEKIERVLNEAFFLNVLNLPE